MPDDPAETASLPRFLAQRARSASDGRLVIDAAGGLLLAAGAAVARPWGWMTLMPAGACFAAFGFWGIVDRELTERSPGIGLIGKALLLSARVVATGLGVVAALGVLFGGLASMLGTWIS